MRGGRRPILAMLCSFLVLALALVVLAETGRSESSVRPRLVRHGPIRIIGDVDFTPENGVTGGTGTVADPYRIAGWDIEVNDPVEIEVVDTTAYFVLDSTMVRSALGRNVGVRLQNVENARLENVTVVGPSVAIDVVSSQNISVNESRFQDLLFGIKIDSSNAVSVTNTTVVETADHGIAVTNSANVSVARMFMGFNRHRAFSFILARDVTVESNVLEDGGGIYGGFLENVTIADNVIRRGHLEALAVGGSHRVALLRNRIEDNAAGVSLGESTNLTLVGNSIPAPGIHFYGSSNDHFASHMISPDNTVAGRPFLYAAHCSDVALEGVSLGQVLIADCDRVRVAGLQLERVWEAIILAFVSNAQVDSNNVTDAYYAIKLVSATDTTLRGNTLRENDYGVVVERSRRVVVFHNNFILNVEAAAAQANTELAWNAPYPEGGNYWSAYAGSDVCRGPSQSDCTGSDGFGDTPHPIGPDSADAYPLLSPWPLSPPVAVFSASREIATVGESIMFDASASYDASGTVRSYFWDFGDGATAEGVSATHVYASHGTYSVLLTIFNDRNVEATSSKFVEVLQELTLVPYDHPSGFRLPVPSRWLAQRNVGTGGDIIDLLLVGPTLGGFTTNVIVDTDTDPTLAETQEFLEGVANQILQEIHVDRPDAFINGTPVITTISGHGAVSFVVQYGGDSLVQALTLVVSDVHDRFWLLLLSVERRYFPVMNRMFDSMILGFEITVGSEFLAVGGALPWISLGVGATGAIVVAVVLRERSRSRRAGGAKAISKTLCPRCRSPVAPAAISCGTCGMPLR